MTATMELASEHGAIAQAPSSPILDKKYVVLHSGVGPTWKKGDVVTGGKFFGPENRVQRYKRVFDQNTGRFVSVVEEERDLNIEEQEANIHRLLAVKSIREASPYEATQLRVELESPVDTHQKTSNEEKIEKQDKEIAELKKRLAFFENQNVAARVAAVQAPSAHPGDKGPTGVEIQPPPGGRSAPRAPKAVVS